MLVFQSCLDLISVGVPIILNKFIVVFLGYSKQISVLHFNYVIAAPFKIISNSLFIIMQSFDPKQSDIDIIK